MIHNKGKLLLRLVTLAALLAVALGVAPDQSPAAAQGVYTVSQANLDGTGGIALAVATLDTPVGIALDVAAGKMYVANHVNSTVSQANLDGTGGVSLGDLGGTLNVPVGIALDVAAGKMYVANHVNSTVSQANLDGTGGVSLGDLGGTLAMPFGIALDVAAGKMYVANWRNSTVSQANLDGTGGIALAVATLDMPYGIALDVAAGKMYVTNGGNNTVSQANLDGTGGVSLGDLGGTLITPVGIALDVAAGKMYVANMDTSTVSQANLDGTGGVSLGNLGGTLNQPVGIALDVAAGKMYVANLFPSPEIPEIDVQRPAGTSIADGGTDNVGNQAVGTVNLTYTIDNTAGTAQLDVTNVTASNYVNSSGFAVGTALPLNVAAGGTATLDVSFNVDAAGAFSLDMDIANNDADENPYDIAITGTGTTVGTIVIKKVTDPAGGTGFEFTNDVPGGPTPFNLDDGQSQTFNNVDVGSYTVTETDPAVTPGGYVLTNLACVETGTNNSTWDVGTRTVTTTLEAGETITCTFTNEADTDGDGVPDSVEGTGDRDGDGIPDNEDYDPTGYFYDQTTGQIIPGGQIAVAGPGGVTMIHDGSSGYYAFTTDGTAGTYIIKVTLPPGYGWSNTCLRQDPPPFDPTGGANPTVLGNGENGATGFLTSSDCTPYYLTFDLAAGDPFIFNNNFPLSPPSPPIPVGGIVVPVNKLGLLAPWMGLAALASLATLTVALVRKRRA